MLFNAVTVVDKWIRNMIPQNVHYPSQMEDQLVGYNVLIVEYITVHWTMEQGFNIIAVTEMDDNKRDYLPPSVRNTKGVLTKGGE